MYELYGKAGSISDVIRGVLEEIGAPYKIHKIDLSAGDQHQPEFRSLNPVGRIPVLIDDGQVISETAAIILHLLDQHPESSIAPATGAADRPVFYKWLIYIASTLQPAYSRFFYPERFTTEPEQVDGILQQVHVDLTSYWKIIDTVLANPGPFVMGRQFSALDIYLQVLASWHQPEGMIAEEFKNVDRCNRLVCDRPALKDLLQ